MGSHNLTERACSIMKSLCDDSHIDYEEGYKRKGITPPQGEEQGEMKHDNVNHPSHYTFGGIECIDAIEAALGTDGFIGYCEGNVLKYLWRHRDKNGVEDLKKAMWYLDRMIKAEDAAMPARASNVQGAFCRG